MAQEEVKSLLRQLKLPIDEGGRRRAANRAEWFNQVNKPLEVYDIFGAPEIGFQTEIGLGRALSSGDTGDSARVDLCGPPLRTIFTKKPPPS